MLDSIVVAIFFCRLDQVSQVWLTTNLIQHVNENGGSISVDGSGNSGKLWLNLSVHHHHHRFCEIFELYDFCVMILLHDVSLKNGSG